MSGFQAPARDARALLGERALLDARALIAVDLGAESCRVSLLRFRQGRFQGTLVHRFPNAPVVVNGELRWPLAAIEAGVRAGLRRCAELAPEGIRSIAVDGWAVDYARIGEDGRALADPFCYRDDRTVASERAIHEQVSIATLRALTGIQIQRINTAYQLVADRMAGTAAARWLNLPEYLLHRLGGDAVAEITNASHTELVASGAASWCDEALSLLGLDRSLAAPIVPTGTIIGHLAGELAELPGFEKTALIAPACHDTASAIAGLPTGPGEEDGSWAYISSGTWSLVGTVLSRPENGAQACAGNYTNLFAAGGQTLFHKGLNGMWLLRQCIEHWEAVARGGVVESRDASMDRSLKTAIDTSNDTSLDISLDTLIARAAQLEPPSHLLDVDAAELLLHGNMPDRIARQLVAQGGAQLLQGVEAAPLYASLIFHSLAARYAEVLKEISAITGRRFDRIYVVGGGSRNLYLNRLIENTTGLPVVRGPSEASTHGNFAVQLAVLEDGCASSESVARWARAIHACVGSAGLESL